MHHETRVTAQTTPTSHTRRVTSPLSHAPPPRHLGGINAACCLCSICSDTSYTPASTRWTNGSCCIGSYKHAEITAGSHRWQVSVPEPSAECLFYHVRIPVSLSIRPESDGLKLLFFLMLTAHIQCVIYERYGCYCFIYLFKNVSFIKMLRCSITGRRGCTNPV